MEEISLRPIGKLGTLSGQRSDLFQFKVPAYQRGYRWKPLQVNQLLDDLWQFHTQSEGAKKPYPFYCLQPVVVKKDSTGDYYELVDGQQRLVTLYILWMYLRENNRLPHREPFKIDFTTRPEAEEVLNDLKSMTKEDSLKNIDLYHIYNARKAIESWFKNVNQDLATILNNFEALFNEDESAAWLGVIWYELPELEEPEAAFRRLNMGKIPLTNAELIRALFLHKVGERKDGEGKAEEVAIRIANEWDQFEKTLQNDAFWYFLFDEEPPSHNRIDKLFELAVAGDLKKKGNKAWKQDQYGVFLCYYERIANSSAERIANSSAESEWDKVKQLFMTLEEWYEDHELFHVIGFLIQKKVGIQNLLDIQSGKNSAAGSGETESKPISKRKFASALRERVLKEAIDPPFKKILEREGEKTNGDIETPTEDKIRTLCKELDYSEQKQREAIRDLLLLFNVATLMSNETNPRFSFDRYKKEKWDIEHIRPVADDSENGDAAYRHALLKEFATDFTDSKAPNGPVVVHERLKAIPFADKDKIEQLVKNINELKSSEDGNVDSLYNELLEVLKEEIVGEDKNRLNNLTLLDQGTNRSYKNALFYAKRKKILQREEKGEYVLPCTRNVFLKCYSKDFTEPLRWGDNDEGAYFNAIVNRLSKFFACYEGNKGVPQ